MSPHELAARLVALRQHSLSTERPEAKSLLRTYRDELAVWTAWLQAASHEHTLRGLLNLLLSEIALERREQGLPAPTELPPLPDVPLGPDVELDGAHTATPGQAALLDRIATDLAAFPDWTITVTLPEGSTVTARPPRDQEATGQPPTASLAPERYPIRTTSAPDHPEPAERA